MIIIIIIVIIVVIMARIAVIVCYFFSFISMVFKYWFPELDGLFGQHEALRALCPKEEKKQRVRDKTEAVTECYLVWKDPVMLHYVIFSVISKKNYR